MDPVLWCSVVATRWFRRLSRQKVLAMVPCTGDIVCQEGGSMNIAGTGRRVRIYTGEASQWRGKPLFLAVLEFLRAEGAVGATVTRGVAGFGANSRIHTATILRLSEDLPIVIDWIDTPERVERLLPPGFALGS